jgi:hypothetical protein
VHNFFYYLDFIVVILNIMYPGLAFRIVSLNYYSKLDQYSHMISIPNASSFSGLATTVSFSWQRSRACTETI